MEAPSDIWLVFAITPVKRLSCIHIKGLVVYYTDKWLLPFLKFRANAVRHDSYIVLQCNSSALSRNSFLLCYNILTLMPINFLMVTLAEAKNVQPNPGGFFTNFCWCRLTEPMQRSHVWCHVRLPFLVGIGSYKCTCFIFEVFIVN